MSKQKSTLFCGAATALITPFSDGRIDFAAFGNLIDRQLEAGIDGLVIAGTTGECATLSDPEKTALFAFAAERIRGRVPLIAGVGCADTAHTLTMARSACAAGADALLVITPYYTRPPQAGLRAHFEAVADASVKPIIVYSVPGRTGIVVETETYSALAAHPNIVAVKEASTDMRAVGALLDACSDRLDVYAGCDELTLPVLMLGGVGTISVLSNVVPRDVHEVCRLWREGKPRLAAAKAAKYNRLNRVLSLVTNPVPVKSALSAMGLCKEEYRLPLLPPDDAIREKIREALRFSRLLPEIFSPEVSPSPEENQTVQ